MFGKWTSPVSSAVYLELNIVTNYINCLGAKNLILYTKEGISIKISTKLTISIYNLIDIEYNIQSSSGTP